MRLTVSVEVSVEEAANLDSGDQPATVFILKQLFADELVRVGASTHMSGKLPPGGDLVAGDKPYPPDEKIQHLYDASAETFYNIYAKHMGYQVAFADLPEDTKLLHRAAARDVLETIRVTITS